VPLLYDNETNSYEVPDLSITPSHTPWTLLKNPTHMERLTRITKCVGRVVSCTESGVPKETATGFYVAKDIILTVAHIIKPDFPKLVFLPNAHVRWNLPRIVGVNMFVLELIAKDDNLDASLWRIQRSSDTFLNPSTRTLTFPEHVTEEIEENPTAFPKGTQTELEKSSIAIIGYNGDVTPEDADRWANMLHPVLKAMVKPESVTHLKYNEWLHPNRKTASPGNIITIEDHVIGVTTSFVSGYCGAPAIFITENDLSFVGYAVRGAPVTNFNLCYSAQTARFTTWFHTHVPRSL